MTRLAVLGATASGKSALALQVAEELRHRGSGVEVVAIDAFTVYRGMDIGTAKPSTHDRARFPHHLVDVLEPTEELTVADFQARARSAIDAVRARGNVALLVGGSGLYWRAVVDDLRFPPTDTETRRRLLERWEDDPAGAHRHLAANDPAAASNIDPANLRRTVRALEVQELTGERFSSFSEAWDRYDQPDDLHVAYLEPDTTTLRERIAHRATTMVEEGLLAEAARLRAQGPISRTAAQAIGYAEAFAVLDGQLGEEALADRITTRTWRYAKRQRGWFRRDPRCTPTSAEQARQRLLAAA